MADLLQELADLVDARARARGDRPGACLVGLAGGVAAGKSTLARQLAAALPARVEVVATDGFLKSNAELEAAGLSARKGFPESYDWPVLHGFLADLAEGRPAASPVYSHVTYDIAPEETLVVPPADIVIVEGINTLQTPEARARYDLSVYLDADPDHVRAWFEARLESIAASEPDSFIARVGDAERRRLVIDHAWREINLVNLRDHIAPTAAFADVVARKGPDHGLLAVERR
jgi:type I pantothenate kinase